MKLLLTSDTRDVDLATCQADGITMDQLMERAAGRVADVFIARYGHQRDWRHVHVFIGPGGNGGDARIVARLLSEAGFAHVKTYEVDPRRPDALSAGAAIDIEAADLVVDGLFGAGLNRPLTGALAYLVRLINDSGAEVVSIDIPSGLMGESNAGNDMQAVVRASLTLTFTSPKLAMLLPESGTWVGELRVLDIGLSPEAIEQIASPYRLISPSDLRARLHVRPRFSHKGTFGSAWLAAGSRGMMGAALIAARAAMRSGVGLLTAHVPGCGYGIMQGVLPEAKCDADRHADHLATMVPPTGCTALAIGPGIGTSVDVARALGLLLLRETRPMVLDADALNVIAQHPDWLASVRPGCIFTPHPKEADRLLAAAWSGGLLDAVPSARSFYGPSASAAATPPTTLDRLRACQALAQRLRVVLVLKGAYTAVCTPSGEVWWQYMYGNAGMAVGGSGDALTGLLLGLLAQGYEATDAALLGVSLHALAADIALAEGESVESLLPTDLVARLGKAFARLRASQPVA